MNRKFRLALAAAALCGCAALVRAQAKVAVSTDPPTTQNSAKSDLGTLSAPSTSAASNPITPRVKSAFGASSAASATQNGAKSGSGASSAPSTGAASPAASAPVLPHDSCANGDCDGAGGVMGGVGLYILRPFINNNTAFVTATGIGTANPSQDSREFDWSYHIAPAVWLGWTSPCGFGFRARYFYFDNDSKTISETLNLAAASTTTITPPEGLSPLVGVPPRGFQSPGVLLQDSRGQDFLAVHSDLRIQTLDGEATYAHDWHRFSLLLSAGGRYLQMSQNYLASLQNVIDPANSEFSNLNAGHNFYGGGPTIAAQIRWQLGGSCLSFFGCVRGSFLVGTSRQTAILTEVITDSVNGNQNNLATNNSHDHLTLPIGELEGGLEYGEIWGRTRVFARAAVVNQTYFDAGSATGRDGNLSLFGVQISLGVNY